MPMVLMPIIQEDLMVEEMVVLMLFHKLRMAQVEVVLQMLGLAVLA